MPTFRALQKMAQRIFGLSSNSQALVAVVKGKRFVGTGIDSVETLMQWYKDLKAERHTEFIKSQLNPPIWEVWFFSSSALACDLLLQHVFAYM